MSYYPHGPRPDLEAIIGVAIVALAIGWMIAVVTLAVTA